MNIAGLTKDEREVLDFARRWYPYGGGEADDILVTFGIDDTVFFTRVIKLLERHPKCIDETIATAILQVARARRYADGAQEGSPVVLIEIPHS